MLAAPCLAKHRHLVVQSAIYCLPAVTQGQITHQTRWK